MTIQYRCRCGQEVTLRPRESTYLLVGLLVGLTLLNTLLSVYLVVQLSTSGESTGPQVRAEREPAAPFRGGPESESDEVPPILRPSTSELAPSAQSEPNSSQSDISDVGDPKRLDVAATNVVLANDGDGNSQAEAVAAKPELPARVRLLAPSHLDGTLMAGLLDAPPTGATDRLAAWLAVIAWGPASLREQARESLSRDALTRDNRWVVDRIALHAAGLDLTAEDESERALLSSLEAAWPTAAHPSWTQEWSPRARGWSESVRTQLQTERDIVILVDLTESMEVEVGRAVGAFKSLLPRLWSSAGSWRWGWVGYRDEVAETQPLSADPDVFLASLDAWRCESGGDVPEGVDRALFETLRFGAFQWRPTAEHVLVVLGDAPPPYERIEGMVSLMGAAHQSPERHTLHALGVLREEGFDRVPGFAELARAGGGGALFIAEDRFSEDEALLEPLWQLLLAPTGPSWTDRPW